MMEGRDVRYLWALLQFSDQLFSHSHGPKNYEPGFERFRLIGKNQT
jgi:hypothetical protein